MTTGFRDLEGCFRVSAGASRLANSAVAAPLTP